MSDFNLRKNPLKIVIVGPQKVGKSVIANFISEFSHSVSPDYHPTVGVRILELEKPYSSEQVANIPVLKKNKIDKVKIELWDMSGDRRFESTWPSIKYGANGVIIVIDAINDKYESVIDEWMNNFCNDIDPQNVTCFSYKKDESKGIAKAKQSHQFPNLAISEVTNSMESLLPSFNKFITKILLKLP